MKAANTGVKRYAIGTRSWNTFAMAAGAQASASAAVMARIAEALVATAVGIGVAVPAVVAFNAFQQRIAAILGQAEALGHVLLVFLEDERARIASAANADAMLDSAAFALARQTLEVTLDAQGRVTLDGFEVADDGAFRAMASERAHDRELRTVIHAPKLAQHGRVMHVLDLLRLSGIRRVAFAVEPLP